MTDFEQAMEKARRIFGNQDIRPYCLDAMAAAHADVVAELEEARWSDAWDSVEDGCLCGYSKADDENWPDIAESYNCPGCGRPIEYQPEGSDDMVFKGRMTKDEYIADLQKDWETEVFAQCTLAEFFYARMKDAGLIGDGDTPETLLREALAATEQAADATDPEEVKHASEN